MSFPKPKRKIDRKLLDEYHSKPCEINNNECFGQVVAHHVRSRGAKGDDVADNLWALCMRHHAEIHSLGTYTFCIKYGREWK